MAKQDLLSIVQAIGNNIDNEKEHQNKIGELKTFLQDGPEIEISKEIFQAVMNRSKSSTKISEEAIYHLLSYCIENSNNIKSKSSNGKRNLSFDEVINYLKDATKIQQYYGDLDKLLNYQGENGDTLLHKAASAGNDYAVKTLLECGVNSLAVNKNSKTPLELAQGNTKNILIEGMKAQANRYRSEARTKGIVSFMAGFISTVGISTAICTISAAVSCSIALGVGAAIALGVGAIIGWSVYSQCDDHRKAEAIENALEQEKNASSQKGGMMSETNIENVNGNQTVKI
ncbi:MAG: ankyrin repeat domain-containing protein [Wolbachia endosymbiont of Tyrophagus putrescentiae]|nr:ankyrin repeat domain-containing protein [Wolbachia endosymbiont of Tyrophagus putrescentiae]